MTELSMHIGCKHGTRSVSGRRLPPYLKRNAPRMQENPKEPCFIFIGPNAWVAAKQCFLGCVCPLDEDAQAFDWAVLRCRPVLIIEVGRVPDEAIHALGVALILAGIPVVTFAGEDIPPDEWLPCDEDDCRPRRFDPRIWSYRGEPI